MLFSIDTCNHSSVTYKNMRLFFVIIDHFLGYVRAGRWDFGVLFFKV